MIKKCLFFVFIIAISSQAMENSNPTSGAINSSQAIALSNGSFILIPIDKEKGNLLCQEDELEDSVYLAPFIAIPYNEAIIPGLRQGSQLASELEQISQEISPQLAHSTIDPQECAGENYLSQKQKSETRLYEIDGLLARSKELEKECIVLSEKLEKECNALSEELEKLAPSNPSELNADELDEEVQKNKKARKNQQKIRKLIEDSRRKQKIDRGLIPFERGLKRLRTQCRLRSLLFSKESQNFYKEHVHVAFNKPLRSKKSVKKVQTPNAKRKRTK